MRNKKKRKPIIARYVRERLFNADFVLVLSEWRDLEDGAKEFLEGEKLDELQAKIKAHGEIPGVRAVQFPMAGGGSVIWVKNEESVGALVHEIVHASHYLLSERAIPLTEETEEVYAYLTEFLFNALTKKK